MIPSLLDGSQGRYRASSEHCTIAARTDTEAIHAWIAAKPGAHTQRAYWKEAERLVLWSVVQRGKALSSLDSEDCRAYCAFLADPQPAAQWCGPRGREKWSPLWRPFEGPLSLRAQRQAITIVKNLYRFLVQRAYLSASAWDGIALPEEPVPRLHTPQYLDDEQWRFIQLCAENLPDTSANMRLRVALHLMHGAGLRLSEAVAAKACDLIETSGNWQLQIAGEGAQARCVTLAPALTQLLFVYLQARGVQREQFGKSDIHLLGKAVDVAERAPWACHAQQAVDPYIGITAGSLYSQLRHFFHACAEAAESGQRPSLQRASARWLRHSHGIQRTADGMPLAALQREMGYSCLRSTTRYTVRKRKSVS